MVYSADAIDFRLQGDFWCWFNFERSRQNISSLTENSKILCQPPRVGKQFGGALNFVFNLTFPQAKTLLERKSSSGFMPFWATPHPPTSPYMITEEQALSLVSQMYGKNFMQPEASSTSELDSKSGLRGFPIPSVSRTDSNFSLVNYWRGPAWINVNYMVYHGMEHISLSEEISTPVRLLLDSVRQGIIRQSYKVSAWPHQSIQVLWSMNRVFFKLASLVSKPLSVALLFCLQSVPLSSTHPDKTSNTRCIMLSNKK